VPWDSLQEGTIPIERFHFRMENPAILCVDNKIIKLKVGVFKKCFIMIYFMDRMVSAGFDDYYFI
jgi:hypothetical protein